MGVLFFQDLIQIILFQFNRVQTMICIHLVMIGIRLSLAHFRHVIEVGWRSTNYQKLSFLF